MSNIKFHSDKRRILPKIERSEVYESKRQIKFAHKPTKFNDPIIEFKDEDINLKYEKWAKNKSTNEAGEILSQAIVDNNSELKKEVLKYYENELDIDLTKIFFGKDDLKNVDVFEKISYNKKLLQFEPKDAATWMDQAINYFELGQKTKSFRCIESAITINKNSGFIVRNTSRLLSHFGEKNKAIQVLKKSDNYKYDPQILSAEIAFSQIEGRRTKGVDFGIKLLKENIYTEFQKSELYGAIGTMEYFNGSYKKSEDLFDKSLIDPTENSMVQSLWYKLEAIPEQKINIFKDSSEVQAKNFYNEEDYLNALKFSNKWITEEKFSIRPYYLTTHLQGDIFEKHDEAYDTTVKAYNNQKIIKRNISKESVLGMKNDLIYHALKMNDISKAIEHYPFIVSEVDRNKNNLDKDLLGTLSATLGLFNFKINNIEEGRKLYSLSIKHFLSRKKGQLAAFAIINLIEAEMENKFEEGRIDKLIKQLDSLVKSDSNNDLIYIKNRTKNKYIRRLKQQH